MKDKPASRQPRSVCRGNLGPQESLVFRYTGKFYRIKPNKQIGRIEVKIQTFTTELIGINILICGFLGRIHGKAQENTNVNHISQNPTEKHIEGKKLLSNILPKSAVIIICYLLFREI